MTGILALSAGIVALKVRTDGSKGAGILRVEEMCEIMQEIKNEGIAEGIAQGISTGIAEGQRKLILLQYHDGIITLQNACTYLNLSEEQFLALEKDYKTE